MQSGAWLISRYVSGVSKNEPVLCNPLTPPAPCSALGLVDSSPVGGADRTVRPSPVIADGSAWTTSVVLGQNRAVSVRFRVPIEVKTEVGALAHLETFSTRTV